MCCYRWHSSVPTASALPARPLALQDGCVIRTAPAYLAGHAADTVIGREVTIGHQASLHGCTVGDRALVGMGATLLEGSVVRSCAAAGHCCLPAGWRTCIALACPLLCLACSCGAHGTVCNAAGGPPVCFATVALYAVGGAGRDGGCGRRGGVRHGGAQRRDLGR